MMRGILNPLRLTIRIESDIYKSHAAFVRRPILYTSIIPVAFPAIVQVCLTEESYLQED